MSEPESGDQGPLLETVLGMRLVNAGSITSEQLVASLQIQADHGGATRLRLGQILVQEGFCSGAAVRGALGAQGKKILWCPRCQVRANVKGAQPDRQYACPRCKGLLQEPGATQDPGVTEGTWTDLPTMRLSPGSGERPAAALPDPQDS